MPFFVVKIADEISQGDFEDALKTATSGGLKALNALPGWLVGTAEKLFGQEQSILSSEVAQASSDLMQDVQNPSQLTSTQITAQVKTIYDNLVQQNISTFTLQDVFAALNSALSAAAPTQSASAEPGQDSSGG